MDSIFSNSVSSNKANFDDLYKTADILICNKKGNIDDLDGYSGIRYLKNIDNGKRLQLFETISFLKERVDGDSFPFQSWRHFKNEHESIDTYRVSEKIKLFLDSSKIANGYSYNLGTIQDITKSGVFGTLQNIAEGTNQFSTLVKGYTESKQPGAQSNNFASTLEYQDRVNIYKNVPYFQDISTSSIDSLSFTFNWGQFGLYNCELEVVKPIFALAHCFGSSIDSYGYIDTPFDAKFDVTTRAYSALFKTADDEKTEAGSTISNTLTNISNPKEGGQESSTSSITKLTQSLNELYTNVAGQTRVRAALIRIAGAVFGPVYVSDVTWEFDYSQQDRYGMPYKGKITLGGIKPVLIDDINTFRLTGGVM